ncbi:GNAT family N-acetyltransferase [Miniphocaeibacter halophilus]|uniref:N-acetyltransferase n=1 Tax=Miniphocaeibacter halophilus TaxID=2931922 RepID=A0AC61MT76_9FIRM|nr:N-acetyltransferase [Miniphocaeibacter halophilus]QQK08827.1 N-acetyltransferase [Miniphocaeibacter halophilus]
MIIRQENNNDYKNIYDLIKFTFEKASYRQGNEHKLVNSLRQGKSYIPELSLVAEINNKIAGYILFTKAKIGNKKILNLAPIVVHPDFQKQGIGKALIEKGHEIAKSLDYTFITVVGYKDYFPKFGYLPASYFGVNPPFFIPDDVFMAIDLDNSTTILKDYIELADEFFE